MGSDTSNSPDGPPGGLRALIGAALPKERFGDHLTLLSGTGQNVAGLAVFVLASLGTSVLVSRVLGPAALGVVTLATFAAPQVIMRQFMTDNGFNFFRVE